jgi:hypothetical protein
MIDTLHVYGIKILGDKLPAEPQFVSFGKCSFQYLVPAVGLQDSYLVVLLVLPYFIGNLHPLAKQLNQFIIEVIDLFPQFFQRRMK